MFALARRFDAPHTFGADGCRVRYVRRQHHPVSWAEIDVASVRVEHDPATDAIQHLFVAVLVPAIRQMVWF